MAPSPADQLFLEELNDARANPAAYGQSIGVDLSYIPPAPPLAWDARLEQAATLDAQDLNARNFFSHVNPDGLDPGQRIANAGYAAVTWGESIAGTVLPQPADALKALIIDQGVPDLGHRDHLLGYGSPNDLQLQVGIGIVQGGSGIYQNYYVIDSAAQANSPAYLTGVVYNHANGNGRYDIGEGLGGVMVTVAGVGSVTTFATGGYSIPLAPGTYSVTASGGGLGAPVTRTVNVGSDNVRLDFNPNPYTTAIVAALLTHSAEYYQDFVRAAYQRYLGRTPGSAEAAGWVSAMQNGLSDEQLEAGFIGSAEYIADHGGSTAGWVTGMYQDLLGRTPSQAEVNGWLAAISNGMSPQQVAYGVAASPECEGQRVTADYTRYLGRSPSEAEVNGWVYAFEHGVSNENVIAGFVGSKESFDRAGDDIPTWVENAYQSILGRPVDPGALAHWTVILERG
jgi:hypothetical protein